MTIKAKILLIIILLYSAYAFTRNINQPFLGGHEWNSLIFSEAAKTYADYGLIKTKFAPVVKSPYQLLSSTPNYYLTHPVGLPLLVSIPIYIFGFYEWSARLVPIIASVASVVIFYFLVQKISNSRIAFISTSIFVMIPVYSYYSRVIVHEPLILCFFLFAVYIFTRLREVAKKSYLLLFLLILGAMIQIDWPGFYLGILFCTGEIFYWRRISKMSMLVLLTMTLSFLLIFSHIKYAIGSFSFLTDRFLYRSMGIGQSLYVTPSEWFHRIWLWLEQDFTLPLILIFCASVFFQLKKRLLKKVELYALFFLSLFPIIHLVLYLPSAYIHDYWFYYFSPLVALMSGHLMYFLFNQFNQSKLLHRVSVGSILFLIIVWYVWMASKEMKRYLTYRESAFYIGWEQAQILNKYKTGSRAKNILIISPSKPNIAFQHYVISPFTYIPIETDLQPLMKKDSMLVLVLQQDWDRYILPDVCKKFICEVLQDYTNTYVAVLHRI